MVQEIINALWSEYKDLLERANSKNCTNSERANYEMLARGIMISIMTIGRLHPGFVTAETIMNTFNEDWR